MIKRHWKNMLAWSSFFLNIILIGMVIVGPHFLMPFPSGPPSPEKMFERIGEDLKGSDRVIFNELLAKNSKLMKQRGQEMHDALAQIGDIARHETLNKEALKQAHNNLHNKRNNIDKVIESFIFDLLTKISFEGRKNLHLAPPPPP